MAQVQSTLPLYFTRFVSTAAPTVSQAAATVQTSSAEVTGLSTPLISALFTWNIVLTAVLQLPVSRVLNRLSRTRALCLSALGWSLGFLCIFLAGIVSVGSLWWAGVGLSITAIATVLYLPSASAFVVDLAPASMRGIYLSINSQCWAIGYFFGPLVGGWALDQGGAIAHPFWMGMAVSCGLILALLSLLQRSAARHSHS